jgi:diguanylate cyclase (GGDEF)-like protein
MHKLQYKILALSLALVAISVMAINAPVMLWAQRDADERVTRSLQARAAVYTAIMQSRSRQMLRMARLTAESSKLGPALADAAEATETARLLERARKTGDANLALALDVDGRLRQHTGELEPPRLALPGLVAHAAEQGLARGILQANGVTYETITVPLSSPLPSGWLTLAYTIDLDLAEFLKRLTGLDVILARSGRDGLMILASTLETVAVDQLAAAIGRGAVAGEGGVAYSVDNQDFRIISEPLIPGEDDVRVILQESSTLALQNYSGLRLHLLSIAGLVLMLALLAGTWIARSISGPVSKLAGAAQRIAEGDYSEPVKFDGRGELHELAVAFNQMQEGIAEREERITYQAQFDELTGLPNRLCALERLDTAVTAAAENRSELSLLVIDLNSLDEVGSSLGHDIGDALLSQAAERMRASLDARHVLARLEADEFLVVMENADIETATEAAEELLRLLGAGVVVRDVNLSLDASVGICAYPQHGKLPKKLLLRATVAKNDARGSRDSICIYEKGREQRNVRQLSVLGDLRRAVRQDEIKLFLQPKINLGDGSVCGAEALVRWDHPSLGFLMPNEFIPIAEQSGNISLITNWALTAAVRECRLWEEEGLDMNISVNLSGHDLLNKDLSCFLLEVLRDHDLAAQKLVVELTEQALVSDLQHASLVLDSVRDLGCKVAMDDFGTGYSSLVQIKNLPVDELKIDRSFVTDLPGSRADIAIVRAAIELAHSLGMEVLAEGVENASALRWLEAHSCERAQGYYIAKPMPAEQFPGWVSDYNQAREVRCEKGDPARAVLAIPRNPRRA